MKFIFTALVILLSTQFALPQEADLPKDFLSANWHKERRNQLRNQLPAKSVAVFFANAVRNRSNDVDYVYHQDPDFYYLTGYREPNAVLLVFKEKQIGENGMLYDEVIFVQPNNPIREMWTGRRLGSVAAKEKLGIALAFNNAVFKKYKIDFTSFKEVLFFDFYNDVRNDEQDSSDLYDLIEQFKLKANYPSANSLELKREVPANLNSQKLTEILNNLRGIKTTEEIEMLRKAVTISCLGQNEVMKAMRPGMSEREVQGIHEYIFKRYQAEDVGYPSIVGGGHNGCILHYIDNYKPALNPKELILMDLGAEYHGYTADITRTIPVGGTFSAEQKLVYDLVLKAQEAGMKVCKEGVAFDKIYAETAKVISEGLVELGITKSPREYGQYYPHGCCHHIGLDVHDRGNYDVLKQNMVITIEPGIYITDKSKADPKWHGIAVRIEDDYLVTKTGCELLSALAPRTIEAIEAMMKQPSPFDNYELPALDVQKK
ncbi:MAG: aminopeptidase P family protein [Cyclobacteriaceae bacterium]|jgi:Xaa-Pro aminopeptidase|nr:aminopeptidase P family protein [Cyclobacteriaceae bacterium]